MGLSMGFIVKKVISFLLMPLSVGMLLALLGLWFLHKNRIKKAKYFLFAGLVWIVLVSSAPLGNLLLKPLESQYPKLQTIPKDIHYILLLGGDRKRRAWEALRLYNKIANVKIVTSGYSLQGTASDAQKAASLLEESGVKRDDILMQSKAKDTTEEAILMKKRVGTKPFILITSAYHMPRAMKLFAKEGLHPIAAPTDFNNPNDDGFGLVLNSKQLEKTEHAFHEYIGLLWLWLKNIS